MWVADRDDSDLHAFRRELESLRLPHVDSPDVQLHEPIPDARGIPPASNGDSHLVGLVAPREPGGGDARTVAGELRPRPVWIPDRDLVPVDREDAVRADAVPDVAEQLHQIGVGLLLNEQVAVAQRVPLRKSHPPPRRLHVPRRP